jgi:hydrophobe/amphiphile efflux-3 (HAE3) family protein
VPETPHFSRMQRFWSWLAVELGKRAGLVAVVGLLLTLIAGYGTTKLQFATGQDSYLNASDQVAKDNKAYQDLFGGQAMLVLLTADDGSNIVDLSNAHNQAEMRTMADKLNARPDLIEGVVSPYTALDWSNNLIQKSADGQITADPTASVAGKALLTALSSPQSNGQPQSAESTAARTADAGTTLGRLGAIPPDQRILDNPTWVDFLIFNNQVPDQASTIRKPLSAVYTDTTHGQIVVRLKGNASIEVEGAGSVLVQKVASEANFEHATVTVTGAPVLLKQINDYLKGGMLQLGGIAVVVMTIILLVLFNVRWRLLPLFVILIGVIWAFGLAGYLGIPLSLVTIAGLPVMLGIGIDYAIQMHARVEEEVIIDHSEHPIQETARNLCPALLVVTFDAVFAFLALRFAKVPMIRQFGLLLAVGIAVICFASIIVPLATLGIREFKSPTKAKDFREGFLGRLTVKLGSLPLWAGPVLAVACFAIFFSGLAVEDKITLQSDPVQWVNQHSQAIKDFRTVEAQTGASSELGIFVQSNDVFSKETVDYVSSLTAANIERFPDTLIGASSLVATMDYLLEVPGAQTVNATPDDVRGGYDLAPVDIRRSTVHLNDVGATGPAPSGPQPGALNVIYRYGPGSLEARKVIVNDIRANAGPPAGIQATPSGLAVVGVGLLENLTSNRTLLTYYAILFVGLFLAVRLKSVIRSLLSLVPVLIAVGAANLVAWGLDLKLSPITAVGGPLVIAACTEFTSLILLRFLEERRRGLLPRPAVDVAAARTGRAFIVSGLTAVSGIAVIATSQLPLLRDFGIVVGLNVAVALMSALIVLPPLLVWADQRGWVSKGEIPDDVLRATTPKLRGRRARVPAEAPA